MHFPLWSMQSDACLNEGVQEDMKPLFLPFYSDVILPGVNIVGASLLLINKQYKNVRNGKW